MMNKIRNIALVLLTLVCITLTIITCNSRKQLSSANKLVRDLQAKSDHRVEPPETIYQQVYLPNRLNSQVIPSTVILPPSHPRNSSKGRSENYQINSDSVAAVELNWDNLKFTFQDSVGNLSSWDFDIKPDKYKYIWVNGQLTTQKLPILKRLKFNPYLEVSYRPLNNLTDIEAGIQLKTSHLNYGVSLSGFYYPKFQSDPGWDVRVKIKYEF